jgi:N6-adenosine-specific RNA methylase IME4
MGFRTILIDTPWNERGSGKSKRGADKHYPLLKNSEIVSTIKDSRVFMPAENAHLWFWVTNTYLPVGLKVIRELGFDYKTNVPWVKTRTPNAAKCLDECDTCGGSGVVVYDGYVGSNGCPDCAVDPKPQIGLCKYLRGSHELLLFATRGKGQSEDVWIGARNIPSVIFAARTKHSKKPAESYDLIESISKGPRLEMFARSGRPGWLAWGNQLNETDTK